MKSTASELLIPLAAGAAAAIVILTVVARDFPIVGHDYRFWFPRLLDTDLHIRLNGMTIQWFTPTFGGGLPAFFNPQHLQYSTVQASTYVINPWAAILLTTFAMTVVGAWALYKFLRLAVNLEVLPAAFGAVCFVANGFYVEHLIAGHLGFQTFPLGAAVLAPLTITRMHPSRSACLIALILTLMLYHASIHVMIVTGLSLVVTIQLLGLINSSLVSGRRVVVVSASAMTLFLMMASGKLFAVYSWMRHFPREIGEVHTASVAQGLLGIVGQLTGLMSLVPVFWLADIDLSRAAFMLLKLVGAGDRIGVWEVDVGLSPILTIALCAGAITYALELRSRGASMRHVPWRRLLLFGITIWILCEVILAKGFIYSALKALPVLRSLHVTPRITSVFILPLSVLGAVFVNSWYVRSSRRSWVVTGIVLAAFAPLTFLALPASLHQRTFEVTGSLEAYEAIRAGERFAVQRIADVSDSEALASGSSSYRPYEPIFGYNLEAFDALIYPGAVRSFGGGYFNLTNPNSLVFPEINGLELFERFKADERDELEAFVNRRQPPWRFPTTLHVLNWIAIVTISLSALRVLIRR